MTEVLPDAPRRSPVNPFIGTAGILVTGAAVAALLGPVFRQANCYPANVGAVESATVGFVAALGASILLFWFGRRASFVWPVVTMLVLAALLLLAGTYFVGPLSLSPEWGGGCGLEAIEIYARFLWIQLPIALAVFGLILGQLSRKRPVAAMLAIVVLLAVIAFCAYRLWFWPSLPTPQ